MRRAPASGVSDVKDCKPADQSEVEYAMLVGAAAARLAAERIGVTPLPAREEGVLNHIFGTGAAKHIPTISKRLTVIAESLPGAGTECEYPGSWRYASQCPSSTFGYVYTAGPFGHFGSIHLCQPQFHNLDLQGRINTVVHEAAHRFADVGDNGYYTMSCTDTLDTLTTSTEARLDNADSYSCLVQRLILTP